MLPKSRTGSAFGAGAGQGLPEAFFGFVKIRPVSMFQPGLDILPGVELLHSAGAAP